MLIYSLWIYWNPNREIFTIPYLNHPIGWYGVSFVTGLIIGYFVLMHLFSQYFHQVAHYPKDKAKEIGLYLTDKMLWYIILGIIIGARFGHVVFYDWDYYLNHPLDVFKIWQGGLSSHGGTIGVMLALFIYYKTILKSFPQLTFVKLMDFVCIPTAIVACFIRIGNFFNQEIVGIKTDAPWGIIFGHPVESHEIIPRHPVQLYEAFCYLISFFFLYFLWKRFLPTLRDGVIIGLFFLFVFGSRIIIEFWKATQESWIQSDSLQAGQLLSIPFVFLGLILLFFGDRLNCTKKSKVS